MSEYQHSGETIEGAHGEKLVVSNKVNAGLPAGGTAAGLGLKVTFQDGPLGEGNERNGAFVEDLLEVVRRRLRFYQGGKYACRENAIALTHVETALLWLNERTRERRERGVEGTHYA